jgi:hypothetical protein
MGIQINGQTDTITAIDGSLTVSGAELPTVTNLNATGIVTATGGIVVGTGASVYSPATNVLSLGTNNTEKVRIDSSGNFNLVNTAGIMTAFKYETPALINNHFKSQSTTAGAYVRMYAAASSGQWDIYGNGANLRFSDNASSGNIQMDRPLSMNSQNIIMSSGYGIDFSATANSSGTMSSEVLSDYETGTWTPTLTASGGAPTGISYSIQTGSYTKIGNMVYVSFRATFTFTNGTGSGGVQIAGLPFTAANIVQAKTTPQQDNITYTGFTYLDMSASSGGTTINFAKNRSGGSAASVALTDCSSGGTDISGGVFYRI